MFKCVHRFKSKVTNSSAFKDKKTLKNWPHWGHMISLIIEILVAYKWPNDQMSVVRAISGIRRSYKEKLAKIKLETTG